MRTQLERIYAHSAVHHQLNHISATKYLQHSWISYTHMCNSYVASSLAGCPYLVSGTSPTHQLRILPGRIPSQPSGHLGQGDIPLTNGISSWSSGELDRWGRTYLVNAASCHAGHSNSVGELIYLMNSLRTDVVTQLAKRKAFYQLINFPYSDP